MLYGYSLIIINRNTSSAFATVFAFEAICEFALFLSTVTTFAENKLTFVNIDTEERLLKKY